MSTTPLIQLDIVSAERELYSAKVRRLTARDTFGELGIEPGHAQLLAPLRPGAVTLELEDGSAEQFYVSGGILEVQPNVVTILADMGVRAHDLDEADALEAEQAAQQKYQEAKTRVDYSTALAELSAAAAQLRIIRERQRS